MTKMNKWMDEMVSHRLQVRRYLRYLYAVYSPLPLRLFLYFALSVIVITYSLCSRMLAWQ